MLRRSKSEKLYPDAWQTVTGSMEAGETPMQSALRELKEETGYTPQKLWVVPLVNTFYSVRQDAINHTVVFAAQVPSTSVPILSKEHHQFLWCSINKAKELCVWPGQRKALEIVHEFIVRGKQAAEFSEIAL